MKIKEKYEKINKILTDWNPIGVSSDISEDEYIAYIPRIIKEIGNENKLFECLKKILINDFGIEFDDNNIDQFCNLQDICQKLINIK